MMAAGLHRGSIDKTTDLDRLESKVRIKPQNKEL